MEKWNELNNLIQTCYSVTQKTSVIYIQYEEKKDHQLILSSVIEAQLYQLVISGQKSLHAIFSPMHWIDDQTTFIYWFQENFTNGQLYTTLSHPRTCSISIGEAPHLLTLSCYLVEDEETSKHFIQTLLIKLTHHIQQQNECRIITTTSPMHIKKQQKSQFYRNEINAAPSSKGISNPAKTTATGSAPPPKQMTAATRMQKLQSHDTKKAERAPLIRSKRKSTSLINPGIRKTRSKNIEFEDP